MTNSAQAFWRKRRRRDALLHIAGAAACALVLTCPLRAQTATPLIGFLSGRSAGESADLAKAFHRGLAETGLLEGKNATVEYRWADGRYDQLAKLAGELVARRVAVIVAVGGGASGLAAKSVTGTIPIVFASGGDVVKLGLVPSLNQPGGNATGVNLIFGALGAKRLELLHELVPAAQQVGMLSNPDYPSAAIEVHDVKAGGSKLGLQITVAEARSVDDFEAAFAAFVGQQVGGLLVADDPFLQSQRQQLTRLAARHNIPTIYFSRDFVDAGGLMSYGPNLADAYRLVGVYAGRIVKGEKPADLPVLQPAKFELVINVRTAKALGLKIPLSLQTAAEDMIE